MKCAKLFEEIERLNDSYLKMLEDVCNIESPTNFKEGIDKVGAYFLNMAEKLGLKCEVFKQEIAGDAVCITLNPDAKNAPFSVSAHIDTVHPVGSFGNPPVRCDEKNMYGPGVMDDKGGAVAALLAMEALQKCGFKERPVQLLLQTDEETGSHESNKATIKYICEKAKTSVAFLNLEGYQSHSAVLERKGILRYRFTVHGKALHSARCADGSNAIAEAAYKILKLEEMKDPKGLTCNCGVINGGSAPNTVAEQCVFYADIRFSTPEEAKIARDKVKQIADDTKISGCSCSLEEVSMRPAMHKSEKNDELFNKINEIYKENDMPVLERRSCLSGSDAAYITECGIPCVDNLGTEGSNIHSLKEYIEKKSLKEAAKRIASVAYCI